MRHSIQRAVKERRQGFALLAALALLALSAALLVIALAISGAQLRSARSERAALDADARARHALASVLGGWEAGYDSLAVGASVERALSPSERGADDGAMTTSGQLHVQRLGVGLYVVAVDVGIGAAPTVARQRLRLLVRRAPIAVAADTSAAAIRDSSDALVLGRGPPTPLARWSVADLY